VKANCLLSLFFADLWPSYFHLSMQTATMAWPKHLLSAVHLLFVIYYLRSDSDHGGCKEAKVSIHRMPNQPTNQPANQQSGVKTCSMLAEIVHRNGFIYGLLVTGKFN